jgi:Fe-S-cluster-containing hydrogenase component 2
MLRNIVHIDQEKCDGCGQCVPNCAEGAIRIVDGKAKLVSDVLCDGLGACLGHCPRGAITILQRDAAEFDEAAVAKHLHAATPAIKHHAPGHACPGSAAMQLRLNMLPAGRNGSPTSAAKRYGTPSGEDTPSGLANWPVQLHLVPPHAPYLQDADLLLVADCVPFAYADFHRRFLDGRPVTIGCPKLDDGQSYVQKLAQIIQHARIRSITVLHMEVPCCTGLIRIAQSAIALSGIDVPMQHVTISIRGEVLTGQGAPVG